MTNNLDTEFEQRIENLEGKAIKDIKNIFHDFEALKIKQNSNVFLQILNNV
jgi:hypothetical protein